MPIESDGNRDRFQFPLRALLLIVTAACVMFGLLAVVLPKSMSIEMRLAIYIVYAVLLVYSAWMISKVKRRPWETPADFVIVKVDAKWKRRISSPLIVSTMGLKPSPSGESFRFIY